MYFVMNFTVSIGLILACLLSSTASAATVAKPKTIHVFVALCDNEHHGIVPVPSFLGNGQDPANNLYWGAMYGIKTFFRQSKDWMLVKSLPAPKTDILERCLFQSKSGKAYMIADAYDGSKIKQTVTDFLQAASGHDRDTLSMDSAKIGIGGAADLVAYIGHNGLMDVTLDSYPQHADSIRRPAIVLACISEMLFAVPLERAGAQPLLLTTDLMAPEAYTLAAALGSWLAGETGEQVRLKAAQAYDQYQGCGLTAAKRMLVTYP